MNDVSPLGPLPPGWRLVHLGDLSVKIGSGATPTGGEKVYLPSRQRFALIRSQCVHDRKFDLSALSFISDEHAARLRSANVQPGDVLLNITGDGVTFSRASLAPPDALPACVNQHVAIIRPNRERLVSGYLLSYLTHPLVKNYIESFNAGGSRRAITKGHIERFLVPLPSLGEQTSIATLLNMLDDKIELNRRMNETLEAMAQAIFRDWFVDFGPTYAKIEGRGPYLAPDIWILFPDSLDNDSKPVGWYEKRFLDHARLISGGTPKTEMAEYWGGSIAWASAKDVSQCSDPFLISTERLITERGLEESSTRMIPKLATVVVARGATTGRFCMFGHEMAMNQTCYTLDSTEQRPFWLNCAFSNVIDALVHAGHGSVFNTITTTTIEGARVIVAPNPLMMRFEETVSPLFNQILLNIKECHTLGSLRDLLELSPNFGDGLKDQAAA